MGDAPERIWRNSPPYPRRSAYHHGLVSWAAREHADEDATEYVRADLHAALTAERDALREALEAIQQYGRDTLSGPIVKSDDTRDWQREAVVEMTKRATGALKGQTDE